MSGGKATLSCRSKIEKVKYVFDRLDKKHKDLFEESCLGRLLKLQVKHIGLQLIHQLIVREIDMKNRHEAWFEFGGKRARFGLQEFTLVTGLNAGELGDESVKEGQRCFLLEKYLKHCGRKINRKDLLVAFDHCKKKSYKFKLGLVVCLVWVLLGAEERNMIDPWLFVIVEDLAKFNAYPWGKKSFLCTLKNFTCINAKSKHQKRSLSNYNLQGFPLAITMWALEVIPAIGDKFATCSGDEVPRMIKWEIREPIGLVDVVNLLGLGNIPVKSTLEPTGVEKVTLLFMGMICFDEVFPEEVDYDKKCVYVDGTNKDLERTLQTCNGRSNDDIPQSLLKVIDDKLEEMKTALVDAVDARLKSVEAKVDELAITLKMIYNKNYIRIYEGQKNNPETQTRLERVEVVTDSKERYNWNEPVDEESSDGSFSGKNGSFNSFFRPTIPKATLSEKSPKILKTSAGEVSENGSSCKRPAQVMDPGPSKVRKITIVESYNPYRVVDNSKKQALEGWLSKAGRRDFVDLEYGEVSKKFFEDLLNDKWLSSEHMDLGLFYFEKMIREHVELFDQSSCILDYVFTQYVDGVHRGLEKNFGRDTKRTQDAVENWMKGNTDVSTRLRRYVVCSKAGKAWSTRGTLYFPCCIRNHWITLRVDLEKRVIEVYDSAPKHIRPVMLKLSLNPFCVVIPWLVHLFVDDGYRCDKFTFHRTTGVCPMQVNGVDCGIMALKFIVFPIAGIELTHVRPEMTSFWRKKLAFELFSKQFDP